MAIRPTAVKRWLPNSKRSLRHLGQIIRIAPAVLFICLVLYYVAPRKQAFTVFASTEYLTVETVSENSPDWELPQVEVCIRTNTPSPNSTDIDGCSNALFEQHRLAEVTLRWSAGYRLVFQGLEPSRMLIRIERDPTAADVILDGYPLRDGQLDEDNPASLLITDGSLLYIPFTSEDRPLVAMRGRVSIGDVPSGRHGLVLRAARYEIRQTLGLTRRPTVVAKGEFFPGDRIGFARLPRPYWDRWADLFRRTRPPKEALSEDVTASLFVTYLSGSSPAFDLVATSPAEFSALRLTRIGSQPTIIPVTWTQRLAADPIPVAVATLLGLLGTAIALSKTFASAPASNPEAASKAKKGKRRKR